MYSALIVALTAIYLQPYLQLAVGQKELLVAAGCEQGIYHTGNTK